MAKPTLEVAVNADDNATPTLKRIQGTLKGLDGSAKSAQGNWKAMLPGLTAVGVGFGTVAVGAKAAFSALESGVELGETQRKFDRLAVSIGTTGEALRTDLSAGVKGLMTDAEQMALATDLMTLGLAKTHEEASRLTTVAAKLGMNMSQLVLTLTNQTTMRFDTLGVQVDGFDEKVRKLEQTGMSADEAFKWAFIEQAEQQVARVGDRSDTTAGQLDQLKVAATNAQNTFKQSFASSAISQLNSVSGAALDSAAAADYAAERWGNFLGMLAGGAGLRAGQALMIQRANALGWDAPWAASEEDFYADLTRYNALLDMNPEAQKYGAGSGWEWTDTRLPTQTGGSRGVGQEPVTSAMRESTASVLKNKEAMELNAQVQSELAQTTDDTARSFGGSFTPAVDEAAEALRRFGEQSGSVFARLRGQKEFNLGEEIFGLASGRGMGASQLADLGLAFGLFDESRANELMNQTYLTQYADQLLAQGVGGGDLKAAIDAAKQQLEDGTLLADEFFRGIDEQTLELEPTIDTDQMTAEAELWASQQMLYLPATVVIEGTTGGAQTKEPPKAHSGRTVFENNPYIVKPDELFIPTGPGRVSPINQSGYGGGGGGDTYNVNIYDRAGMGLWRAQLRRARLASVDRRMGL